MTIHGILKAYFQLDLSKFEYWFNGLKIDDIDQIKAGFREVFNQPGFYDSILNSNMLNANLISKTLGLFGPDKKSSSLNDFLQNPDTIKLID